jgi:hypothetical protein
VQRVHQEDRRATGTCTSDSRDARAAGGIWIQLYDDALVLSQQRTFYAYSAIANATASAWNDLWLLTVLAVTSMRRRGGRSLGDSTQQPRRVATVPSYPHQNHQINRECATLAELDLPNSLHAHKRQRVPNEPNQIPYAPCRSFCNHHRRHRVNLCEVGRQMAQGTKRRQSSMLWTWMPYHGQSRTPNPRPDDVLQATRKTLCAYLYAHMLLMVRLTICSSHKQPTRQQAQL